MTKTFKLAEALSKQIQSLGPLRHAWFTSFNLNVDFFERHVLSTLLQMDNPRSRVDFELMQQKLNGSIKESSKGDVTLNIDVKVFADQRMYQASDIKRTAIEVYGVNPALLNGGRKKQLSISSLFHPKVIFLQDIYGNAILGGGSANLTLSGWSSNQEVFTFQKVECKHQAEAIKDFFKPLFEAHKLDHKTILTPRRFRAEIKPDDWSFVHTFVKNSRDGRHQTLLSHMFGSLTDGTNDLVVWSPYFPADLAGFIQRLRSVSQCDELKLHIIPDLVENQKLRTQWSSTLLPLLSDGSVGFYRSPIGKDERSDLCHAKVWMTHSKLAIGSWNFTTPGSNVLLEDKIEGQVNIEAGIVVENQQPLEQVLSQPLSITEDNFMLSKELEEHALEVSDLLPLDVNIAFDWRTLSYNVEISLCDINGEWPKFELQLPDLAQPFIYKGRASKEQGEHSTWSFEHQLLEEPKELLVDHAYKLNFNDGSQHRGFIVERNSVMRRVEQFDSLDDIFSSLIDGRSLESNANSSLRNEILGGDQDWLYEQDTDTLSEKDQSPTLSYFRMFQAMDNLQQRITRLKSNALIEQYAFVIPGCLVEIGEKIRSELQGNASVFNWYMKQEFNLLIDVAKKQSSDSELKTRLSGLRFKSSDSVVRAQGLQSKIGSSEYRKLIKEKCKYVSI
ncbi:hypothetical protein [Vibrio gigantis]|uniref:Uncharacterized protein n=1 Tax=Vibrio gigantis TaxID=296199 RepID=A0A5M9P089_9VIBR|nr:hypothetical protein [Vibrio gigantis]KAA8677696.1 hypothetical protein F4W18_09070 [Vibrio gigantis]